MPSRPLTAADIRNRFQEALEEEENDDVVNGEYFSSILLQQFVLFL